jgi:hypothetical protein
MLNISSKETDQKISIRVIEAGLDALQRLLIAIEVHQAREAASDGNDLHRTTDVVQETTQKDEHLWRKNSFGYLTL